MNGGLAPGTRLGPYEIVGPLGAGGMGEVYRARDTRLGREVAVKVLAAHLTDDPELRSRFEREARSVAALNHPHICALYDVGREGDREYLVMELLEGETLAARLARGALPAAEVLKVGAQVADALDRAHRQGLVHRDLKPGNVMLTKQGAKLLDFGLARPTPPGNVPGSSAVRTILPSAGPVTAAGVIVGTFQYMAPEQLEGREADARSDLWSLGTVLYQMATGRAPFEGESQARLIVSILATEPKPISELVPLAPPALDRLVRACLAKDPDERIQTAHDVKLQLRWIEEGGSQAGVPAPVAAARRQHDRLGWILAAVAATALVAFAAWTFTRPAPRRQTARFEIAAPPLARAFLWPRLSPDGSTLAYLATDSTGARRIHVRRLDAVETVPLAGTESAERPFWSPDGATLAFMAGDRLKRISATGGAVQLIAEARGRFDGSWGADGTILLDGGPQDSILAVSSTGGEIRPATSFDRSRGEAMHAWPSFLPDGRRFLFIAGRGQGLQLIKLGRLGSLQATVIDSCDSRVEYVAPGYLLFGRNNTLYARRFDLGSGRCSGEPTPVVENLGGTNQGDFSGSLTGTIAYRARTYGDRERVVLVDRAGRFLENVTAEANYSEIALSPDDTRLAFSLVDPLTGKAAIWVRDLRRGTTSRLTFDAAGETWPVWSPDGTEIAYSSPRPSNQFRIYAKPASGSGEERALPGYGLTMGPTSWSAANGRMGVIYFRDGNWNFAAIAPRDSGDILEDTAIGNRDELQPSFSPDGRWVGLVSSDEVFIQSFPVPSSRWQISTATGRDPLWRSDGKEFFFRSIRQDTLYAVPVSSEPTFEWGTPAPLFRTGAPRGRQVQSVIQPTRDGQRFYVLRESGSATLAPITVVLDWAAEVERTTKRRGAGGSP